MSNQREAELIYIIFTTVDVEEIAEETGIDPVLALERAKSWASYIEDMATNLINDQLVSCIESDSP